jgi:hypothetical protein
MSVNKIKITDRQGNVISEELLTPITEVHASVVNNSVGTPEATATYDDGDLTIAFSNIKGETGNTGPTGPQGATGIYDQNTQDFLTTLETTTGDSQTKTMTQKAITDAIDSAKDAMGEMVEVTVLERIRSAYIVNDTITSSSTQTCWYFKVKNGSKVNVIGTNGSSANLRIAFTQSVPEIGSTVQDTAQFSGTSINVEVECPFDGYCIINHSTSAFADRVIKARQQGGYSELQQKASVKTLMDVLDVTGFSMSNIEPSNTLSNKSINIYGDVIGGYSTNYHVKEYTVQEDTIYQISGRITASGTYAGYVFYDIDGQMLSYGITTNGTARNFSERCISPKGAVLLRVSGSTSAAAKLHGLVASGDMKTRTILPLVGYEYISYINGQFGNSNKKLGAVATQRFIKVGGDFTVELPITTKVRVFRYDDSFSYLGYTTYDITANEPLEIQVGTEEYVKLLYADGMTEFSIDMQLYRMKLVGPFPEKWDYFNVNEAGDGFAQMVTAWVHCTDPTSYIDDIDGEMTDSGTYFKCTNEVQDTGEYFVECGLQTEAEAKFGQYLYDYGRIALPPNYSNTDAPVRLIICCHGAAVQYVEDEDFDSGDLEPEYWLAEGYAILDVEGNPFDNINRHFYTPQSIECYTAAYKWAINHFNIRRDGVLLTGRSMGGGNTFSLIRSECPIPVIAACPNVPCSPLYYWNYMDATRRTFNAKAHGFKLPDGFSWTNASPMTQAEWDVVKENWDKWARFGLFGAITDLPSKDVMMADNMNIGKSVTYNEAEDALYSSLHARVKCPVKIFAVKLDDICKWKRTALYWYKMLLNGGQLVEMRVFEGMGNTLTVDNHHADLKDERLRCTVTTKYGEEMTNVPVFYVEMLRFWRRFEQE